MKKRIRMKLAKRYRGELVWAIYYGQFEKVKRIIRSGIDVNESDENGVTALRWATQEGHLNIIQLLLSSGANIKYNRR
ncbi:ankyrin repeat domain-containing protein [Paenisporosarcina quisquiliarum]|uniref:ankyrin repeat domain-containing protein n=1 Tax=Paenisporosarcina quisquiliarum TaxID=365346 RepID=UPI003734D44A